MHLGSVVKRFTLVLVGAPIPVLLSRLVLLSFTISGLGLMWDMQWHGVNPIRDHYFIAPHVVIYVGIVGMLAGCALLSVLDYSIPVHIFALFPLLSMFDEFWHRTFGVELAASPMMFWSPAHWPFGIIMIYILWRVYILHIETNEGMRLYTQALIFAVLPVKLVWYLLIPLAPYSHYAFLHTPISIIVPVVVALVFVTSYKVHRSDTLTLVSFLILAGTSGPYKLFLIWNDFIYNPGSLYFLLFVVSLFIWSAFVSEFAYLIIGCFVALWVHGLLYLATGQWVALGIVFDVVLSLCAAGVYFYLELALLNMFDPVMRRIRIEIGR